MFSDYRDNLQFLHKQVNPKIYLEIGVETGRSLILANDDTLAIGVDPQPMIQVPLKSRTFVFKKTSDDFFKNDANQILDGSTIDLAFIDGMHLFEFVLRDFINVEKYSSKNSIITVHDILPKSELTASRVRETGFWTGDVYKFVLILKKYRPDLKMFNSNIAPAGLAIIGNLNPESKILEEKYDAIVDEFMNFSYDELEKDKENMLSIEADSKFIDCIQSFIVNF